MAKQEPSALDSDGLPSTLSSQQYASQEIVSCVQVSWSFPGQAGQVHKIALVIFLKVHIDLQLLQIKVFFKKVDKKKNTECHKRA